MANTGLLIAERRKRLGLRQSDLCVRLGIAATRKGYISRIENNAVTLTPELLRALERALEFRDGDLQPVTSDRKEHGHA